MKIQSITLFHLKIPCKSVFSHAKSSRDVSEVILVRLTTDKQLLGWGEILPREYVTGETIESIMGSSEPPLLSTLIGRKFDSPLALFEWIEVQLNHNSETLSLLGGIELALWDLLSQHYKLDLDNLIGPKRTIGTGHCMTIGFNCASKDIRSMFLSAKLKRATAIKLKVGVDIERDIDCILQLHKLCNNTVQLRLDGNGAYTPEIAAQLLSEIEKCTLHSFEEPLALELPDYVEQLYELRSRFDVDLMADESLCSQEDADRLIDLKCFQWFNIRVGKHGGLIASSRIRDKAHAAGIGAVSGSMVGETAITTRASSIFLQRSASIDYVEGLGQNRSWLEMDPFSSKKEIPDNFYPLHAEQAVFDKCVFETRQIN